MKPIHKEIIGLIILIILLMLPLIHADSAEFLIKAKSHGLDLLKAEDVSKMTELQKESYEARSEIGDVIVVRPDGWKWGKCECLPYYIVIKVPAIKYQDAIQYEIPLVEVTKDADDKIISTQIKKRRKFQFSETTVLSIKNQSLSSYELSKTTALSAISQKQLEELSKE